MNLIQNSRILQSATGTADSTLQRTRPDGSVLLGLWSACRFSDKSLYLHIATRVETFFSASVLQCADNNERTEMMP